MSIRRPLVLWLALVCPAFAAEPKAVVRPVSRVEPGHLVIVDGSRSTGDVFTWIPLSGVEGAIGESGKIVYFATPKAGRYPFLLVAVGVVDGKAKIDTASIEIVVEAPPPIPVPPGPTPTPDPPKPDPTPTPDPPKPVPVTTEHLYATYIADANKLLPSHAAMKMAPLIRAELPGLDTDWRWYASDESEPKERRLLNHVNQLPAVVVQDPSGAVVAVLVAPSEKDVVDKIKKLRGK